MNSHVVIIWYITGLRFTIYYPACLQWWMCRIMGWGPSDLPLMDVIRLLNIHTIDKSPFYFLYLLIAHCSIIVTFIGKKRRKSTCTWHSLCVYASNMNSWSTQFNIVWCSSFIDVLDPSTDLVNPTSLSSSFYIIVVSIIDKDYTLHVFYLFIWFEMTLDE